MRTAGLYRAAPCCKCSCAVLSASEVQVRQAMVGGPRVLQVQEVQDGG